MKLSIVLPAHNEAESLPEGLAEVLRVLDGLGFPKEESEVIVVDDGSSDGTFGVVRAAAAGDSRVRGIRFRGNAGQTAAMSAGFAAAKGDAVVALDADLQNDPADIPALLAKLDEGYGCVSGWRKDRKDAAATRNVPSRIGNRIIAGVTGLALQDLGCSLKAYRREAVQSIALYGEMHRFIPALIHQQGWRVAEVPVNHRARRFGASHYRLSKAFRVLLDLLVVKFMGSYVKRPIHFFGGLGFVAAALAALSAAAAVGLKIFGYRDFVATPLPIWSGTLAILAVQLVTTGVLAEVLSRVYFRAPGHSPYLVAEEI